MASGTSYGSSTSRWSPASSARSGINSILSSAGKLLSMSSSSRSSRSADLIKLDDNNHISLYLANINSRSSDLDDNMEEAFDMDEVDVTRGHYRVTPGFVIKADDASQKGRRIYINVAKSLELEEQHCVAGDIESVSARRNSPVKDLVWTVVVSTVTLHRARLTAAYKQLLVEAIVRYLDMLHPHVHLDVASLSLPELQGCSVRERLPAIPRSTAPTDISILIY